MKIRLFAVAMLLSVASLTGAAVLVPLQAHAASKTHTGSITKTGIAGTYNGTAFTDGVLRVTNLAVNPVTRTLTASGTLSSATAGFSTPFTAPVQNLAGAACPILTLTLGPLNLNLLGLVVSIPNPIVLNVTAVPGPGNLLGNLLCAVANLLNGGGLGGLTNLLAQISAILAGLGL